MNAPKMMFGSCEPKAPWTSNSYRPYPKLVSIITSLDVHAPEGALSTLRLSPVSSLLTFAGFQKQGPGWSGTVVEPLMNQSCPAKRTVSSDMPHEKDSSARTPALRRHVSKPAAHIT
jgi:hypothetical protein